VSFSFPRCKTQPPPPLSFGYVNFGFQFGEKPFPQKSTLFGTHHLVCFPFPLIFSSVSFSQVCLEGLLFSPQKNSSFFFFFSDCTPSRAFSDIRSAIFPALFSPCFSPRVSDPPPPGTPHPSLCYWCPHSAKTLLYPTLCCCFPPPLFFFFFMPPNPPAIPLFFFFQKLSYHPRFSCDS